MYMIKIVTNDGLIFTGYVADVVDKNEDEDGTEDYIDIDLDDGKIVGFYESEIARIEDVKE